MIYIDGIEYIESNNDKVRSAVIDYLENWTVTVSTSGTTGEPKKHYQACDHYVQRERTNPE